MSTSLKFLSALALATAVLFAYSPASAQDDDDDDDMGDGMDGDDDGMDGDDDGMDGDGMDGDGMDGDGDGGDGDGEDGDGDAGDGDAGGDAAAMGDGPPSMITAKGKLAVAADVSINLSADAVGKPLAIRPDVVYGLMPKLDVGVYHTPGGIIGFWNATGGGLCLTGTENGCAKFYNGPTGILVNYSLAEGKLGLAANGGVAFSTFDPFAIAIKAGVHVRYMLGPKMMIMSSPNLFLGLTERDAGNEAFINLPAAFGYAVSPKLIVAAQTGIRGPLDGFGDFFQIPLSVGAMFHVSKSLAAYGSFGFLNIAGKGSSADFRDLTAGVMWRN